MLLFFGSTFWNVFHTKVRRDGNTHACWCWCWWGEAFPSYNIHTYIIFVVVTLSQRLDAAAAHHWCGDDIFVFYLYMCMFEYTTNTEMSVKIYMVCSSRFKRDMSVFWFQRMPLLKPPRESSINFIYWCARSCARGRHNTSTVYFLLTNVGVLCMKARLYWRVLGKRHVKSDDKQLKLRVCVCVCAYTNHTSHITQCGA